MRGALVPCPIFRLSVACAVAWTSTARSAHRRSSNAGPRTASTDPAEYLRGRHVDGNPDRVQAGPLAGAIDAMTVLEAERRAVMRTYQARATRASANGAAQRVAEPVVQCHADCAQTRAGKPYHRYPDRPQRHLQGNRIGETEEREKTDTSA